MRIITRKSFLGGMTAGAAAFALFSVYAVEESLHGMDLYLLMGQSNMAGCGALSEILGTATVNFM